MMNIRNPRRRALAAVGALTAVLALTATAAVATEAEPSDRSTFPAVSSVLPDPSALASLHLVKHESPATDLPADGLPVEGITNPVIEGVEFTIRRHPGIDLTTRAGWVAAQDETVLSFPWSAGVYERVGVTDASGLISFYDLPLGLWMVQETYTPVGVIPAAPFIVALPMTHPVEGDTWMYDVFIYPKNAVVTVGKTVNDYQVQAGEAIEWIIRADVPALPGETIEMFRIVDVLDERLLWMPELFIPGELQVWLEQPGGGAHSSIEASLFTVTHTDATSEGLGGTLTIDFTAAGRAFLDAQPVGVRIVVVIRTTLVEVGDGVITNQARLYPNSRAYADSRPVLSNTPESRFGGIQALKVDNTNHDNVLAGAVFQVFASEADARAGVNALSIGEVDTWTTDADGLLTINGLRLSNWANGQAVTEADEGWNTYWLVEVQAPQGFELLAEPIPFHVLTTGAPTTITLTVENIPTNAGFRLPLTGGTGTTILTVGGLALAGAAVALKAAHSRRARNQAA